MVANHIKNDRSGSYGLLHPSNGLSILNLFLRSTSNPVVYGAVPKEYWAGAAKRLGRSGVPEVLQDIIPTIKSAMESSHKNHHIQDAKKDNMKTLSRENVNSRLLAVVTSVLDNFDPAESFGTQGLDSLASLELQNKIKDCFGQDLLSGIDIFNSTLDSLAQHIKNSIVAGQLYDSGDGHQQRKTQTLPRTITPISPPEVKMRLFCLPWAGGVSENLFAHWNNLLPPVIQVCPVEIPGRGRRGGEEPLRTVIELADELFKTLPFDDKPYAIFGTCLGAIVGYQLILKLREENRPLPILFMPAAVSPPHVYAEVVMKIYMQRRLRT